MPLSAIVINGHSVRYFELEYQEWNITRQYVFVDTQYPSFNIRNLKKDVFHHHLIKYANAHNITLVLQEDNSNETKKFFVNEFGKMYGVSLENSCFCQRCNDFLSKQKVLMNIVGYNNKLSSFFPWDYKYISIDEFIGV